MKTKLRLRLALWGLLLSVAVAPLHAQISEGGLPPSFAAGATKQLVQPYRATVDFDVKALLAEDAINDAAGIPPRIGRIIPVELNMENSGEWTNLPSGERIWRLTIKAPGSLATMLFYNEFHLPKGGKLFIYNTDRSRVLGAFTSRTNPKGAEFATEFVEGDELVLEYVQPLAVDAGKPITTFDTFEVDKNSAYAEKDTDRPRLAISGIVYGYNHIRVSKGDQLQTRWQSLACQVNVNCPEGANWQHEKRGVTRIVTPTGGTTVSLCSGTIVNNTANSLDPLFLSAHHCFDGMPAAQLNQTVYYFQYEWEGCENLNTDPTVPTMVGAQMLVDVNILGGSDGALLRLNDMIPESYNVFYNGWDRRNVPATSGVGIHHPAGDVKKISTYTTPATTATWAGSSPGAPGAHWQVFYNPTVSGHSITQGGSSGSPLFNQDHRVVGTLTGGPTETCTNPTGRSLYGKLWYHWDQTANQMAPYLDPISSGAEFIDGIYATGNIVANFSASKTEVFASESVTFTDMSYHASTWEWTFTGGIPASFTGKTPPAILYNTPGSYDAKLVINSGTADEKEKTVTITVKQKEATCPVTQVVGTGTSVAQFPLGIATRQAYSSSIYTAAELGNTAGAISEISWNAALPTALSRTLYVYLQEVDDATLTAGTWANEISGATLVYQSATSWANDAGWTSVKLATPFAYDGVKNLKVIVRASAAAAGTTSSDCYYTTTANTHMQWTSTTATNPTANGTVNDNRPNIKLTIDQDCGAAPPIADFKAGLNEVLLEEGFDGKVFPPAGWVVEKPGASAYKWEPLNHSAAYHFNTIDPTSTLSAFIRYDNASVVDTWLKSPAVSITDATTKLEFYMFYEGTKLASASCSFYISTDGGTTWGTPVWTTGNTNIPMAFGWRKQTIDLSAYNGQSLMFAWEYSGQAGNYMAVDGVRVFTPNVDGKTSIFEGQQVRFTDLSSGPPVLWNWTLPGGDPATSSAQNPVVTYMTQGVYDATLDVTNNLGSDTKTITGAVTVTARTPLVKWASSSSAFTMQANFGQFLPLSGGAVAFEDKSDYYPTSYLWTLTGATPATSTSKDEEVVYPAGENSYPVTLDATNVAGTGTLTIPNYVKVGGTADVWNVQYGEDPIKYYTNSGTLIMTPGVSFFSAISERFDAPAAGIVTSVKVFTRITAGNPTMVVGIYADNGGVPGALISTSVAVPNLANMAYSTVTFPQPVAISGAYHVVLSKASTPAGTYVIPTVDTRASGNTVYAYYGGVFQPISSVISGFNVSMNVVPEFTYTALDITGATSVIRKNVDATSASISVTSNAPWTVTADSWVELSATSGTGNGSFNFMVKNNTNPTPRSGLVTVKGGGVTKYVIVQQAGTNPTKLTATFMDTSQEPVSLAWQAPVAMPQVDLFDDAEGHSNFVINSAGDIGWSYIDGDAQVTYGIDGGTTFPGSGSPMAFIVFNPSQTTPASVGANTQPHSGNKYFACFAATTPPNNDWMVSPPLSFTTGFKLSFWAKSATDNYSGGERMRVAYSTGGKAQTDFVNVLTVAPYVVVPTTWTRYEYNVPANARYVAINCVSNDEFIFMVDDIFIGTGVAPASALATEASRQSLGTPEWATNGDARKQTLAMQNIVSKKSTSKLEAATPVGGLGIQNTLLDDESLVTMAGGTPPVKLRWDNGVNVSSVGIASGAHIEVAIRFETPELFNYHGSKLLAVDIFPKNLGNSMVLNIRQGNVIVHSQPISGLTANEFNRITLSTPITIDASKELTVGYEYDQNPSLYVAGCGAGPAVSGKGDLIALDGGPLEALSDISTLNYNWNIAALVENKAGDNFTLAYNVYRNGNKIATVEPNAYDDLTNIQHNSCYKVTAVYNDVLESTPSNEGCLSAQHLLTVSVADITRTVGEANPAFVLSYSGFIDGDTDANLGTKPTAACAATVSSPVGTYPITILGGADSKYRFEYVPGTLTVERKEVVVTADNASRYVGQANPVFALSYSGFIDGDTDAVLDTKPVATTVADHTSLAGTYPIVPAGGADDKYKFTYVSGTLTVLNQVELIVGVSSVSRNVGDANPTFVLQYSGFVGGDTPASLAQQPTATCFATAASPVGTYPITVSGGADSKYKFTYVPGTLTVTAATQIELVVGVKSVLRFFGEANPPFELQYSGFVGGDTPTSLAQQPTATCFATSTSFAGTYPITVSGGVDSKYKLVYVPGTLTVVRRPLTITVQNATRKVGQPDPVFQLTYSGFVGGDTPATLTEVPIARTEAGASAPAGTYVITLNGGSSDKYNITVIPGVLTIEKYQLVVSVKNVTRREKESNPTFELTYSGFVDGDSPSMITDKPNAVSTANALSPAGAYPITLNGGSNSKYEFTLVPGTLTVTAAPVNKESNAFTPYDLDGYNDVFMAGAKITVVNRYGQLIFEGNDGWNGKKKNSSELVPPGVYYFQATLPDGTSKKGSVNVIKK